MSETKLNYLKPIVHNIFMGEGRREKAVYLKIPKYMDLELVQEDVNAGASQYKEVLKLLEKKVQKFIIIKSKTREEGLMAVSYIQGVLNRKEALRSLDETGFDPEDNDDDWIYDDEDDDEENGIDPYEEYDEDEKNVWIQSAYRVPIISLMDVRMHLGSRTSSYNMGIVMAGGQTQKPDDPYWAACTTSSICIEEDRFAVFQPSDVDYMDFFRENQHVYLLSYEEGSCINNEFTVVGEDFSNVENGEQTPLQQFQYEMLLRWMADSIMVKLPRDEEYAYYKLLFTSWLSAYKLTPEKNFPMEEVVNKIIEINRENKSDMIDRLLRVLIEKEHVSGTLKQEEIMTLEVFRYISAKQRRKKKNAAAIQLEKELVGMESVKQQIQDIVNVMKVNQFRAKKGMPYSNYHNVHLMIGAPGTAKTTVAQILGNMMVEEKLLPGNRFISVNGAELKGMYVGHSAPKTRQIFEENDIIMIDEAYSLTASGNGGLDTFAQEVLAQLMIELEEHATDKLVLFAGYGGDGVSSINNKMLQFLNANPGLKSRINSTIYFPSYSAEDMVQIVHRQAENMGFTLDPHADKMIYEYFKERVRDVDFGNGREARSLIEACNTNITKRACKMSQSRWTKKSLQTIKVEDVMYAIRKKQNESHAQIGVVSRIGF